MKKTMLLITLIALALFARKKDMIIHKGGEAIRTDVSEVDSISFEYYYTIDRTINGSGSISPGGTVNVLQGGSQALSFTPDAGQRISSVSVNGVDVGAVSSYSFSGVTGDSSITVSFEEAPFTPFQKTSGGAAQDAAYAITPATGGYILAGSTTSFSVGDYDFCAVKIDENGDTLWTKSYGRSGASEHANAITPATGGYIIVGYNSSSNFWAVKIDEDGDTLWTRSYEGTAIANAITPATDGYILVGYTNSGSNDFCAVKIDESGDTLWTRTYGGADWDMAGAITPANGGYIIAGLTKSFGAVNTDFWAVKIDESGDTLWTRKYGGAGYDHAYAITSAEDGYILVGMGGAGGTLAVKIDEKGDTLWTRTYGGVNEDVIRAITPAEGGYILTGHTSSYGAGYDDFWALKIDESGDTLWTKTYGGTYQDKAYAITPAEVGYILTGESTPLGPHDMDIWSVKIDEDGNSVE